MNLTICLLVARSFVPKDRIRQAVEGYHGLGKDAFDRMFDRDKEELRLLGIPIEVGTLVKGFEDEVGYRIPRSRFELPPITLDPEEAAVIGLAARVWQHARFASAASQGLRKLRAAGFDVDESALDVLEPQLATDEPAFDGVFDAVTRRQPIRFGYQASGATSPAARVVEPWGIVSWHGHWYLVGYDRDRAAPRMFRVSRFTGSVGSAGEPGSYQIPEDVDVRAIARSLGPPPPDRAATVRVRRGTGDELRRRANAVRDVDAEWSELDLAYGNGSSLADELTSFGPDVIVVGPEDVREGVVRRLTAIAGEGTR